MMSRLGALLAALLLLAYPLLVWWGLSGTALPLWLPAGLALLFVLRLLPTPTAWRPWFMLSRLLAAGGLLLCTLSLLCREAGWLLYYPLLVSLGLLLLFGWSLFQPMSLVERLARLQEPDLPPAAVSYTRRVTQVWCLFFAANGLMAAYTIYRGDLALWSLYNGLISYLLMGTLMAGEYLIRRRIKARLAQRGAA